MPNQPAGECYLHKIAPTPLVPVQLEPDLPPIWCKLEFLNPSGSTKDRIARHILEKARRRGVISTGSVVVEASSGSTSIALALACAQMQLKFVAYIPESATNERSLMIQAYGGEVRRVSGGMSQVLSAAEVAAEENGWFHTRQFSNPDNVEAHRLWTGPEILSQIPSSYVDVVVSGVGTGGTLQGLYEAFDTAGCAVKPVAAIPRENEVFGDNIECCSFKFSSDVPGVVDGVSQLFHDWSESESATRLEKIEIGDCECLDLTRKLWRQGFPVGPSSGLNLGAALKAAKSAPEGAKIVTVFPDRMERYFSHKVFETFRACDEA
ncbi:MAG: cysteine synthase A [Pseudoalteromonas tetraodonis]|jgi:cysteine synthase A